MASIMRDVLRGEHLATKTDIDSIRDSVNQQISVQNGKIASYQKANNDRITVVENQNQQLQEILNQLKAAIESKNAANVVGVLPVDSVAVNQKKFVPRFVYARGFAQWSDGRPPSKSAKLRSPQYFKHGNELVAKLPEGVRQITKVTEPFPTSHEISFSVAGGEADCHLVQNRVAAIVERDQYQINGHDILFSVEASPQRKAGWR